MAALLVERATHPDGPYGRATKVSIYLLGGGANSRADGGQSSMLTHPAGDGGLISRACCSILMVERLRSLWSLGLTAP